MVATDKFLEPEMRGDTYVDGEKKALWKLQLDMLEMILSICKKHSLSVSLAYGSMLGAVRHKGFIPWDDDLDVVMPRDDYNRFLKIAAMEVRLPYVLQTQLNDPANQTAISRLRSDDSAAILRPYIDDFIYCHQGVFIDIYPLEKIPTDSRILKRKMDASFFVRRLRRRVFSMRRRSSLETVKTVLARAAFHMIGAKRFFKWQENLWSGYSGAKSDYLVGAPGIRYSERKMLANRFPAHCCREMLWVPFEYLMVPIFSGYDEILTLQYGEWRKPVGGGAAHGSAIISVDMSYRDIMSQKYGFEFKKFSRCESSDAVL